MGLLFFDQIFGKFIENDRTIIKGPFHVFPLFLKNICTSKIKLLSGKIS